MEIIQDSCLANFEESCLADEPKELKESKESKEPKEIKNKNQKKKSNTKKQIQLNEKDKDPLTESIKENQTLSFPSTPPCNSSKQLESKENSISRSSMRKGHQSIRIMFTGIPDKKKRIKVSFLRKFKIKKGN